ncbi:MAG: Methylated-DNA--protein-cysteine methyltransferase [Chlamydiia bacterium]|nr:Methylated-DNA--protein-cysteine methyltransferase [Chlamydiia bacterium]
MKKLYSTKIKSPIGDLFILSDESCLYLLEFDNEERLNKQLLTLQKQLPFKIIEGCPPPLKSIEQELEQYFCGKLKNFKTAYKLFGTPFQQKVWKELINTPFGTTKSYQKQAHNIGTPKGFRAVANANGRNKLSIIIPCHRIINANGKLGGYGGGLWRKEKLLALEKA